MNIVMISSCQVVDRHIVGEIVARWPDTVVIRPSWGQSEGSRGRAIQRSMQAPVESLRRGYHRAGDRRRNRRLKTLLPDVMSRRALAPQSLPAGDLNRPVGIRRVEALRPEVLVLCGAPILRDAMLAVPTIGTVNIHFGIAPEYRGEHTLFHALRRRDYDHVGLSIHRVDRGVDTGPLIVQAGPGLEPSDNEATVVAKCAALAAGLLVEQLEIVERTGAITGQPQTGTGTLYLRSDRRVFRHDLLDAVNRGLLRRRPPHRPGWVTHFADAGLERA